MPETFKIILEILLYIYYPFLHTYALFLFDKQRDKELSYIYFKVVFPRCPQKLGLGYVELEASSIMFLQCRWQEAGYLNHYQLSTQELHRQKAGLETEKPV